MLNNDITQEKVLNDLSASFWLKNEIMNTEQRDPVDVLNDLHVLTIIVEARLKNGS